MRIIFLRISHFSSLAAFFLSLLAAQKKKSVLVLTGSLPKFSWNLPPSMQPPDSHCGGKNVGGKIDEMANMTQNARGRKKAKDPGAA